MQENNIRLKTKQSNWNHKFSTNSFSKIYFTWEVRVRMKPVKLELQVTYRKPPDLVQGLTLPHTLQRFHLGT